MMESEQLPITVKNQVNLKVKVTGGLIAADEKVATDLKTSKLFLFAPVVEGCDQNYDNLNTEQLVINRFLVLFSFGTFYIVFAISFCTFLVWKEV